MATKPRASSTFHIGRIFGLQPQEAIHPLLWHCRDGDRESIPRFIRWIWHPKTNEFHLGPVIHHYQLMGPDGRKHFDDWVRGFYFPEKRLVATVIAEKYEAMVTLGIANSRMKDFYDLWILARNYEFDGPMLSKAILSTFRRRKTQLPTTLPAGLSEEFASDRIKQNQWKAFIAKGRLVVTAPPLFEVIALLQNFLWSPTDSLISSDPFDKKWKRNGPWT